MTDVQPSPPKPWEKNKQNVAQPAINTTNPATNVNTAAATTATTQAAANNLQSTTLNQNNSNLGQTNTYGNNNNGYNNGYNSGYGINNGMYGNSYGGAGYGGGYGGGGYGGGYGRMGMMNGGGYMPYGSMGMPLSNMGMVLGNLHHATSSLGQMGELLGMNVDSISFALNMVMGLIERLGLGFFHAIDFATGRVDLKHYQQVDPQTGQPLPLPTVEEVKEERKQKAKRWTLGLIVIFLGYKVIKYLIMREFKKKLTPLEILSNSWDKVTGVTSEQGSGKVNAASMFQEALGMNQMQQPGMGMSPYGGYGQGGMYGGYGQGGMYGGYGQGGMYGGGYGSSMYGGGYGSNMYGSGYGSNMYGGGYGDYNNIF